MKGARLTPKRVTLRIIGLICCVGSVFLMRVANEIVDLASVTEATLWQFIQLFGGLVLGASGVALVVSRASTGSGLRQPLD